MHFYFFLKIIQVEMDGIEKILKDESYFELYTLIRSRISFFFFFLLKSVETITIIYGNKQQISKTSFIY